MAKKLSPEEIETIISLINQGWKNKDIAQATGRGENIISKIRHNSGMYEARKECNVSCDIAKFLIANWHWKTPVKTVKRRSDFRTPYNCRSRAW